MAWNDDLRVALGLSLLTGHSGCPWYYFGCHGGGGHYLWQGNGRKAKHGHPLGKFDGSLCLPPAVGERVAALTRLGALGYSALAFWDYSIDRRPGSNSIIFAPSLNITAAEIAEGAKVYLPLYEKRWPSIDVSRAEYRPEALRAGATGIDAGAPSCGSHQREVPERDLAR